MPSRIRSLGIATVVGALAGILLGTAPAYAAAKTWVSVSEGASHTCAIDTSKHLYCWGNDASGQLGDGTAGSNTTSPHAVSGGRSWVSVSAGQASTCGITTGHQLYCWGDNGEGQIGDGTVVSRPAPTRVGSSVTWASVSVGAFHACGLATNGRLRCWGDNASGKLGDGTTMQRHSPELIGTSTWTRLAAGNNHTCAIRSDKRLLCWGENGDGELGDGTTTDRHSPTTIGSASWARITSTVAGSCGITAGDNVFCWGGNVFGEVGDGTAGVQHNSPVNIGTTTNLTATADGGGYSVCGVTGGHRLRCWGYNTDYNLGDDTTTNHATPVLLGQGHTDWTTVSMGNDGGCGIRSSTKHLFCWGRNAAGEAGNGTNSPVHHPTLVD